MRACAVLIPLNSGHQSGLPSSEEIVRRANVLIPLNSGHQSGLQEQAQASIAARLNPFEFRASVRTAAPRRPPDRAGS